MKIVNRHGRVVPAPPKRVAALIADFDRIWPTQITPAPSPRGRRQYDSGPMIWEEFDRPGAARALRVISPKGFDVEHWFELERVEGGTLVRHTLEGHAPGKYEAMWSEQIEPFHNRVLEGVLDNVEAAASGLSLGRPGASSAASPLGRPPARG
jgi:hypothetical protein